MTQNTKKAISFVSNPLVFVFSFLSFHFHFFIMDFYVFVSKDCAQLVLEEKCCGNGVVGHFVVTVPFPQPD